MYSKFLLIALTFLIFSCSPLSFAQEDKIVIFHTQSGELVIELFPEDAPNTVDNFLKLADENFYDRTIFHRIIKDFMIQGGDPLTKPGAYKEVSEWGTGDAGYTISAEFNSIIHNRGIVSMARSADPDSASSQFFIIHKDSSHLDGQYTAFGRLITEESYQTLDTIASLNTTGPPLNSAYDWGKGEIRTTEVVDRNEIANLSELEKPERFFEGKYTNDQIGFSFVFPKGWLIQESEKTVPNAPEVSAFGPQLEGFVATISISSIASGGKSLDQHIEEVAKKLQPSIENGQ